MGIEAFVKERMGPEVPSLDDLYFRSTFNIDSYLFYDFLLSYLLRSMPAERMCEALFLAAGNGDCNLGNPHLLLHDLLRNSTKIELNEIRDLWERWKAREEPKFNLLRLQSLPPSVEISPKEWLGYMENNFGLHYYGYQPIGDRLENGIHHVGSAIHKSFGPILDRP